MTDNDVAVEMPECMVIDDVEIPAQQNGVVAFQPATEFALRHIVTKPFQCVVIEVAVDGVRIYPPNNVQHNSIDLCTRMLTPQSKVQIKLKNFDDKNHKAVIKLYSSRLPRF